jgi:hypothetical protein
LREMLNLRYESMWRGIQGQVKAGNLRAVEVGIKISKAIAELNGLTQVVHLEQNVTNVMMLTPEERESRVEQLLAKAAERAAQLEAKDSLDLVVGDFQEAEDALPAG